jgi:competence protein ComEA
MLVLTPAERRGAALVVLLLLIGAAHDLWRLHRPSRAMRDLPPTRNTDSVAVLTSGDSLAAPGAGAIAPADSRVDLNAANRHELESLPGIGPVLAGRILERRARARFRVPEDLLSVRGIGPRLYARLLDRVRVSASKDSTPK